MNEICHNYIEKTGITAGVWDRLVKPGYLSAPASKGHHLASEGGLVTHSVNVTKRLLDLTEKLGVRWPRPESPYIVGMYHDLVKCVCYAKDGDGYKYVQPPYPGHGACSVAIATELGIKLVAAEIIAITYHMGMFGVGREYTDKEFNAALDRYAPLVISTHTADWWAARCDEEFDGTKPDGSKGSQS